MTKTKERKGLGYFITLALLAIYCDGRYMIYLHHAHHNESLGIYKTTAFTYSMKVPEACYRVMTERGIDFPPEGISPARVSVICTRLLKLRRKKIGNKNAIILTSNKLAQLREQYGIEEYSLEKTDSEVTYGA